MRVKVLSIGRKSRILYRSDSRRIIQLFHSTKGTSLKIISSTSSSTKIYLGS